MQMLLGVIEDNAQLLFYGKFLKIYGDSFSSIVSAPYKLVHEPSSGTEYPFFLLFFRIAKMVDAVTLYNLLVVGSLILVLLSSYLLLNYFVKSSVISLFLALLYTISPYFMFQTQSHPTLLFVWAVVLAMLLIIKYDNKSTLLVGVLASVLAMFSNYMAFFLLVFYTIFIFSYAIVSYAQGKSISPDTRKKFKFYIFNIFIFACFALVYFGPMFLRLNQTMTQPERLYPDRSIEDFFLLTSRPWYFVLPSSENPFYGQITTNVINNLQSTNYYLFNNYFVSEHSASYLGLINIAIGAIGVFIVFKRKFKPEHRVTLLVLFLTFIGISILMMPPFISIAGLKFYMPSYLVFKTAEMFRALVRLGSLNLMIVLIFTGIGYEYILTKYKDGKSYPFVKLGLLCLALISLSEFWTPINFTYLGSDKAPEVFRYLALQEKKGSIVNYPYSYANSTLLWHDLHKKPAFNSKFSAVGFDSRNFTNNLISNGKLIEAGELGAKYLIVFNSTDINFFDNSPQLIKIKSFERNTIPYTEGNWLFKINNPGPLENATLYLIKDK